MPAGLQGGRVLPFRRRRRPLPWIVLAALVMLAATVLLWARLRRRPEPSATAAAGRRSLEEHGGRCATPPPPFAHPVACPYVGLPAPPAGAIDYGAPFAGRAGVTCASAGTLVMPTGGLVAADPFVFLNERAFTVQAPPGAYPVFLAMADGAHGDVALALLRLRETRPVRWEIAVLPGEKPGHHFYPVDAGTGCYVDRAVAREILAREEAELERQIRGERKGLLDLANLAGYDAHPAASVCIDASTGGNVVVFRSGAGDGTYGVYAGYDEGGAVAAFVTDFQILDDLEPEGGVPP